MTCTNCASDDAAIAVTCAFVTFLALHMSIAFESVKSGMDSSRSRSPVSIVLNTILSHIMRYSVSPNSHVRALFLNSVTSYACLLRKCVCPKLMPFKDSVLSRGTVCPKSCEDL